MTRLRLWIFAALALVMCSFSLAGNEPTILSLRGHLDKETIDAARKTVTELRGSDQRQVLVELSSTSGDLLEVLGLAKDLYQLREETGKRIVVYIEEDALGPAAAIPLLADEITTSVFVSWGDIPLGTDDGLPTNILRSRVRGLVPRGHTKEDLLKLMAAAMVDKSIGIVDDNGWRLQQEDEPVTVSIVSPEGERLVVDHNQLRSQGIVAGQFSTTEFRERYGVTKAVADEEEDEDAASSQPARKTDLMSSLGEHIKFNSDGSNEIGRIVIDDRKNGITQATWIYVKAALDVYKERKPAFIVLELNTPGGEVFSAQRISDALKEMDTTYNVPVVAFINNWAISAGAMLAYSCRYIAIAKDASMGAAEPVLAGQDGTMKSASEKINSALRADFANRAGFFERDPLLAQAMVDKDMILVRRYGKIIKLDSEDQIRKAGYDADEVVSAKGKLLTLDAKHLMDFGVADILLLPKKLEPISAKERETNRWSLDKSLLSAHPFFGEIPDATVITYEMTWQLKFLAFLSLPAVASVLFLGLMLGAYLELNTPGFGLPGSIALACLSLIMLSSMAMEAASILEVIMVVAGLVLIAVEIFVLPGFGIAGLLGIALFVGGIFALMLPGLGTIAYEVDSNSLNAAGLEFMYRLTWLAATFIIGVVLIAVLAQYVMPRFWLFNRLVLVGEQTKEEGYYAGAAPGELPSIGARGEVIATLRPAGRVLIDGQDFDAVSSGGFLEKGTQVVVVHTEGSKIVVEEVREGQWDKGKES